MTSFLNACGIQDSLKLTVEGPDADQAGIRILQQPFAIIGRDVRADVVLDHSQVSRRHIYLQLIEGRAFWIDLGSRAGTRAGQGFQNLGWLEAGRTLGIGPYKIRLSIGTPQNHDLSRPFLPREAPFLVRAYSQSPLPEVALEFLNGPSRSTRWPVHRVMSLLGSASGCKLRLSDPSVSRFHASLLRTPAGLWVVDMLGQRGVTVNSVPVRFSRLEDGDVLEIGRYQIRVHSEWQSRDTGNPSQGSRPPSTLRLPTNEPNRSQLPDWAAGAMGFAPGSESPQGAEIPLLTQPLAPSSSMAIIPSERAFPATPGQSDSTDSMLVPLVNQFGLMQQQMFDQFQQAMSMLVQMFGKMHRDQMDVIRAELDRLHELTDELQSLKEELAKRSQGQSQPVSSEPKGNPAASDHPSGYRRRDVWAGSAPAQAPPAQTQTTRAQRSAANSGAVPTGFTAYSPFPVPSDARKDALSAGAPLSAASGRVPPERNAPPPVSDQPHSASSHPPLGAADSGTEVDAEKNTLIWLHQRIMSIQDEREGRWQKILKLLPGVS